MIALGEEPTQPKPRFDNPFSNTPAGRHRKKAREFISKGEREKAIEQFTASIALEPDEVWQYDARANLYAQLSKYDLALKDAEAQLRLQPNAHAYIIRGIALTGIGKHELAWKDYDSFLKLNPDIPWGWGCRFYLAGKDKNPKARTLQECELLKKSVSSPWVDDMLAQIYIQQGCYDLARPYVTSNTNPAIRSLFLIHAGHEESRLKHFDKAVRCFTEALSLNPQSADMSVYLTRCHSLVVLKRYDEALKDAAIVLSHPDPPPEIYILKAQCFLVNDRKAALKVLEPALAKAPKHKWLIETNNDIVRKLNVPDLMVRDCQLMRKNVGDQVWAQKRIVDTYQAAGRQDLVDAYLDELTTAKPQAWVFIAKGKFDLENFEPANALLAFKQASKLDPRNPKVYLECANLLVSYFRCDLAKQLLDQAIPAFPKNAALRKSNAKCLQGLGLISRALDEAQAAIDLNPRDSEAYYLRAKSLMGLNDLAGAIVDLNECVAINQDFPKAYMLRGSIHADCGHFNSAVQDFSHYLCSAESTPMAYASRAHAYWKLGEKQLALNDLNTLVKLTPREDAYDARANLYIELGDYESALKDFCQSLRTEPNSVDALLARGNLYQRIGRHQLAIADFSAALMLDKNSIRAYEGRARARSSLNQDALASADRLDADRLRQKYKTGIATFASSVASCLYAKIGAARRSFTER